VATQGYQMAPWPELVALWQAYNRHLAHAMANVPPAVRTRAHQRHNFARIPVGQPATLEDLMRDYVAHLKHHLGQIATIVPHVSRPVV
jgi:hypothetical protein